MSRILDQLADQHEERIINTLYRLEDDIIRQVTQATGGNLDVETRLAIQLQPQLRATIENVFLEEADLINFTREHLAGYKLPKQVLFVDEVMRAPNGKANYKWAKQRADEELS